MAETIERTYNIPLRKEFQKAPRWKKTKRAVAAAKSFLSKHMKSEDIRLGKDVNEAMWKHGGKNPPHHINVKVTKDKEGVVRAVMNDSNVASKPAKKVAAKAKAPAKKSEEKTEAKAEEKKADAPAADAPKSE